MITNIPGKTFGFSFLLDAMKEDEYENPWEETLTQNSHHGFQVKID